MEAIRYKPIAIFRLDDTTPVQDYSGYGNTTGVTTGSIGKGIALTSSAEYSSLFDFDSTFAVDITDVYQQGKEAHPWTISAVVLMTTPGENEILSKNTNDGLSINGTVVSFGTAYTTEGTAVCTYDFEYPRKAHLVGVHTENKNSLYFNGQLVAEVDITPEQQADTYASSSLAFNSGDGTGKFLANNYGFFPRALRAEEITAIYLEDERRPEGAAAKMFGGEVIPMGIDMRSPYLDTGWYTEYDWNQAQLYQVEPENSTLYSSKIDDLTLGGTWMDSISVYKSGVAVPIAAINLWWNGENVTVETSKDGTTWNTASRGVRITTYSVDETPTHDSLFIRVTFASGVENSWIRGLRVHGYTGNSVEYTPDRTITYPSAAVLFTDDPEPGELRDDWGADLQGNLWSITNSVVEDRPKTVEIWWKRSASVTLSSNLSGADTIYTNGVVTGDRVNEWVVKHYVKSTGFEDTISISGNVIVGHVAFYPDALTVGQIESVVKEYTRYERLNTSDGLISIAESPSAWQAYGHDWEIQSA